MEWMQITSYKDEEFQSKVSGPYKLMLNPESLKWNRQVQYNKRQPLGTSNSSPKFKQTPSSTLSFEFTIDCTGVVDGSRTDMVTEMTMFENIVFTFNGSIHRPNYVVLQWGKSIIFKGVLDTFDTTYTFFKGDGTPLRARINVSFSSFISSVTLKKVDNYQSPDVTHLVDVIDGFSLPQLCRKVLGDDAYTVPIAKFNGLDKFRKLKVNKLIMPPIIKEN